MHLITWTPILLAENGFPRDGRGNPFIRGSVLKEAILNAATYYYVKKDREIEAKVRTYLLREELEPTKVVEDIKEILQDKYLFLKELEIPEKISLSDGEIYETTVEVFDLKKQIEVNDFRSEVFRGTIELEISFPDLSKLKAIGHSYCESLCRAEMSMLKNHPLIEDFYVLMLNGIKKWDIPLRVGMWTEDFLQESLLFFRKVKEIRKKLMEKLKIDIRPKRVLYLPAEKCTVGWCELKSSNL